MTKYIIRRLLQTIPVLIGVTILVFSLMHLVPGNPAQIIAGEGASEKTVQQIEERLGLNEPIPVQYAKFVGNAVQGDLGSSVRSGRPVMDEIGARFWVTVELALCHSCSSIPGLDRRDCFCGPALYACRYINYDCRIIWFIHA